MGRHEWMNGCMDYEHGSFIKKRFGMLFFCFFCVFSGVDASALGLLPVQPGLLPRQVVCQDECSSTKTLRN